MSNKEAADKVRAFADRIEASEAPHMVHVFHEYEHTWDDAGYRATGDHLGTSIIIQSGYISLNSLRERLMKEG